MSEHQNTRRIAAGSCLVTGLLSVLALTPAHSTTVNFNGYLVEILEKNGTSVYAGAVPGYGTGTAFSGSFTYGDSPADAVESYSDPGEADWVFRGGFYGGVITDGITATTGVETELDIIDDWVLTADEADVFSLFAGNPISAGTTVDIWSVSSLTSGAFGAFYDDLEPIQNGMVFGIGFYSLDGSLYSGLGYQNLPPDPGAVDGGFLYIEDADVFGNTRLLALGRLEPTAVIPVPAAAWLFGSGLLGLIGIAQRRSNGAAASDITRRGPDETRC